MSYIPMEDYPKAWIFRHKELLVSEEDLAQIKPLTTQRARDVWRHYVSEESTDVEHFDAADWPARSDTWLDSCEWESVWDSAEADLPLVIAEHIQWEGNTTIYFCYNSGDVIETNWSVFKRHWKNFLFYDEGPLLIGKKRKQVAQFKSDGIALIGEKP